MGFSRKHKSPLPPLPKGGFLGKGPKQVSKEIKHVQTIFNWHGHKGVDHEIFSTKLSHQSKII